MIQLHQSTKDLEGTAYFEFLPGPYRHECWGPNSIFLDEEAFGFIEPIFRRLCPKYDHYAFMEMDRSIWHSILKDLDALAAILEDTPSDEVLSSRLGFFFQDTRRKFFENRTASVNQLREMLDDLTSWLRIQLKEHSVISLLGL